MNLNALLSSPASLAGLTLGLGSLGSVAAHMFRLLPSAARAALDSVTTSITVHSSDRVAHDQLKRWLADQNFHTGKGALSLDSHFDWSGMGWTLRLSLGPGLHLVRFEGVWFVLHRLMRQGLSFPGGAGGGGGEAPMSETITLVFAGRNPEPVKRLVAAIRAKPDDGRVRVCLWRDSHFEEMRRQSKRPLATVHIPEATRREAMADAARFLSSRQTYLARGLPYRRGYMLHGEPGTGKTSFAFALASHFDLTVNLINLAAVASDNELQTAFARVGADALVLIEDVDACRVNDSREAPPAGEAAGKAHAPGITLSGLLNAIDGVIAAEGRILVMTTNHLDRLDPALFRPGRADKLIKFSRMEMPEALAMFQAYYPDADPAPFAAQIAPRLPISPAAMHDLLIDFQAQLQAP
jgi:hypothetical protein